MRCHETRNRDTTRLSRLLRYAVCKYHRERRSQLVIGQNLTFLRYHTQAFLVQPRHQYKYGLFSYSPSHLDQSCRTHLWLLLGFVTGDVRLLGRIAGAQPHTANVIWLPTSIRVHTRQPQQLRHVRTGTRIYATGIRFE